MPETGRADANRREGSAREPDGKEPENVSGSGPGTTGRHPADREPSADGRSPRFGDSSRVAGVCDGAEQPMEIIAVEAG